MPGKVGPTAGFIYSSATNRNSAYTYDANGNATQIGSNTYAYDVENRLVSYNGAELYAYGASNNRVWKKMPSGAEEVYFWVGGRKLGTYVPASTPCCSGSGAYDVSLATLDTNLYFSGMKVISRNKALLTDHTFYPYGEEQTSTSNDADKYATYYRDATTGLDYAVNRFYTSLAGQFLTPDLSRAGANSAVPLSWNRYAFVLNDPINGSDPLGLCTIIGTGLTRPSSMGCNADGFAGSSWSSATGGGLSNGSTINNGFGGEGSASYNAYSQSMATSFAVNYQIWYYSPAQRTARLQQNVAGASQAFNAVAGYLNLNPNTSYTVTSQVCGDTSNIRITNPATGQLFQYGDLSGWSGTADQLSIFHGGNNSSYENDQFSDVLHIADITSPYGQVYPGLDAHIDQFNPESGLGFAPPVQMNCSVNGGCSPRP